MDSARMANVTDHAVNDVDSGRSTGSCQIRDRLKELKNLEDMPYIAVPMEEPTTAENETEQACYAQSFSVEEADSRQAKTFFQEYGFIVFRNVISSEKCQDVVRDMWKYLGELTHGRTKRKDPATWRHGLSGTGIPVRTHGMFRPSLLQLRQDPSVFRCFAALLGTPNVMCGHDRFLMQVPTRLEDGGTQAETRHNVHLDLNPWDYVDENEAANVQDRLAGMRYETDRCLAFIRENNEVHSSMGLSLQGMLNMTDLPAHVDGGGTIVVPGSHCVMESWAKTSLGPKQQEGSIQFRFPDNLHRRLLQVAQRVPMRAGSLLIWDQRVAHGSKPNRSSHLRCGIPIRFFDAEQLRGACGLQKGRAIDRAVAVGEAIDRCGFSKLVTNLGHSVFGLDVLDEFLEDDEDCGEDF